MRSLVTGGAGFIGSHLVRALLERGDEVRVLDNFSTGHARNLHAVQSDIDLRQGDIRCPDTCHDACKEVDSVFHLGALGSVPRSIADPVTTDSVNCGGTLNMLVAARDAQVKRFVFSSSSSVYGNTATLPKQEGMKPCPRSPYAVSKLAAEAYCQAFSLTYGLEAIALRYFNVFGPRQDPTSQYAAVIPRFITALQRHQIPVVHGDGQQSRDFTYVLNVVEANLRASESAGGAGEVFNIACGDQVTLLAVLREIASLLNCEVAPEFVPERAGDVRHSCADITAATRTLGYRPTVRFEEGMARTVRSFLEDR